MEQKTKKLDIKIIIIAIVVIIAIVEGIVIITSKSKGTKEQDIVGTYSIAQNNNYYIQTMELYKGGTGKGFNTKSDSHYTISWEIKDDILNITIKGAIRDDTTGYIVKGGILTSVDGEHTYYKK